MTSLEHAMINPSDSSREATEGGFTLMEVLIAITILSVGLLAIASMQIAAIQTTGGAKFLSQGIAWAEDRMEMLNTLAYDNALLADTAGGERDENPATEPAGYDISWSVDDDNPEDRCKLVTVFVRWNEGGRSKVTTLTSVIPELL